MKSEITLPTRELGKICLLLGELGYLVHDIDRPDDKYRSLVSAKYKEISAAARYLEENLPEGSLQSLLEESDD